jgi:hypothetical protein
LYIKNKKYLPSGHILINFRYYFCLTFFFILFFSDHSYPQNSVSGSGSPDYHFRINDNNFFPIGWYNTSTPIGLEEVKNFGANITINYWNGIWGNFGSKNKNKKYSNLEYLISLKQYLDFLNSIDMKAIVALGIMENGKYGFSQSAILDIVKEVKDHPAVFGWYLYDEPYSRLLISCGEKPKPGYLKNIADQIRTVDKDHPLIPVVVDPRFFADYQLPNQIYTCKNGETIPEPLPFDPSCYDAIGWDCYVYSPATDENKYPWRDYNDVARMATKRGMVQVKKSNKMGLIFVAMAHDRWPGYREITMKDIIYQSLSPVIHGARGLLYFWWHETDSRQITKQNVNHFIRFFREFKLDQVVMTDKDYSTFLNVSSFKIDGIAKEVQEYKWANYNNGDPSVNPEFVQLNYILRKYENDYYLLVTNDYRSNIEIEFDLKRILSNNQIIIFITELNLDLSETPVYNFLFTDKNNQNHFSTTLQDYKVRVFKIRVL